MNSFLNSQRGDHYRFLTFIAALVMMLSIPTKATAAASGVVQTNRFRFIDLSALTTGVEGLAARGPALSKGVQSFQGIPFAIGGRVAVMGIDSARAGEFFSNELIGIKVSAKAKRIHLLHGTLSGEKDGVPLAKIVFHYAGGAEESVRIGFGIHVRELNPLREEKRPALFDPNSHVAWSEGDEQRGGGSRIFQTAIENPRPAETIASMDVVSLFSRAALLIAAMSVENFDSGLPQNEPLPARKAVRDMREFGDSVYRRELLVRVTDGDTGGPLTNAVTTLTITDDEQSFLFGETRADSQGICRVPFPPQQVVGFSLWVHAPGRVPVVISESKTNRAQFKGEYSVALRRGTVIGGVVQETNGNAVAGAEIVICKVTNNSARVYTRVDYDRVITGKDGKWTSSSVPADLSGLVFNITQPDYRPMQYATAGYASAPTNVPITSSSSSSSSGITYRRMADGTLVPMTTTRRTTTGRQQSIALVTSNALLAREAAMQLQPALLVEGTLVDNDGKPVPAAEVILQRSASSERRNLRTDQQGRFRARIAEPGIVTLFVLRDGFTPVSRSVNVQARTTPVEIKLAAARVLRGHVQDRSGRPVSGASVRIDEWNGMTDLLRFRAETDDNGSFTWTGAPADQLSFYVSKPNYYNTRHSVSGTASEVTISLGRSPGVAGKVFDAETKQPIESFAVIPGRKYSPSDSQIHWERYESGRGQNGEYSLRVESYMFQPEARILIEASGYEPQISPPLRGSDFYTNDFAMKKGRGVGGIVLLPDGSPAVNATLVLVEKGESASLGDNGQLQTSNSGDVTRSDAKGRFAFSPKLEPEKIFAAHEEGFAEIKAQAGESNRIVLQKWGRVKAAMRIGDTSDPDEIVRLQNRWERYSEPNTRTSILSLYLKGELENDRNFVFKKVPPGEHRIALEYRFKENPSGETPLSHGFFVTVKPGETTEVTLGGTGRRVTGRVTLVGGEQSDVDWKRDVHKLSLVVPGPQLEPPNVQSLSPPEQQRAWNEFNQRQRQFWQSDAGRAQERAERAYVLVFGTNGYFHADNVPPGKYNLSLNVTDPEDDRYSRRPMGNSNKEIVVPDEPKAKVNALFEIAGIELTIRPRVKIGKAIPPVEMKTPEGKTIKLPDYRGKFVLLHFWGLSLGYSTSDFQSLRDLHASYGGNGKLVVISCNLDADEKQAEQFAKRQSMTWTQVYLGDWSRAPIPGLFGVHGNSACVLIDGEGKLASSQLRGSAIRTAVLNALSGE